ncbi:uncharacterized protein B0T15DRAFT_574343 [Chaetomium strumarium]|uniref:Kelch repeat-containing protein n=1 Tax=Chaetomium strumarium TaxID=1170767 RepID=A0AAJ0GWV2_9PEZI|nr:hypothetical protein B0T15DRAFT_574343 [Chaetomium strumarium]
MSGPGLIAVMTALASLALGQAVWLPDQVNTRICQWRQLRAAVLRDTVYLDGGYLLWQPGFTDGSTGNAVSDDNPLGLIYTLNLSTPFNTTQNISAILGTLEKGAGANLAPNYQDGALLGNNEEFFLYGGVTVPTSAFSDPPGDSVLGYYAYQQSDAPRQVFRPQFLSKPLGVNVTRYVAYGGAASAPSENLAWYFSGLRSRRGGPIYDPNSANDTTAPVEVSETLIILDMAEQQRETFTNKPLPPHISGRANPEFVWVPIGSRGIVVALGGVVYPDFVQPDGHSQNATASESQSPEFMSTIDIYEVASGNWYRQQTTGGPKQLTRGCAVVARAQDSSSFNIYYYGGYDGLHQQQAYSDDVWVLSLPSFTWVKLASSDARGRAGHKCVTPYPDQMLVIGGYSDIDPAVCLKETIRVFNLSAGAWIDRYDPAVYSNYTVPSAVYNAIGGSGTGSATGTTPSPSGWDSNELASVFATPYPMSKITTYYPYASVGPTNTTNPNVPPPSNEDEGGGVPSYLAPVLGVVLGVVFLTVVAVLLLLWRRRRYLRRSTLSEAETEDTNGHRIKSWLRGQPSEVKAPTITSYDYTPPSSTDVDTTAVPQRSIAEMMNTEVHAPVELPGSSFPAELHDNPLSTAAAAAVAAHSSNNTVSDPSVQQTNHSAFSDPTPPPIPHDDSPIVHRPDSDALGRAPTTTTTSVGTSPTGTSPTGTAAMASASPGGAGASPSKVLSGVSNLSERDRAHLRQISDTTVSSVTTAGPSGGPGGAMVEPISIRTGGAIVESPAVVSPPTATGDAPDYLSARSVSGIGSTFGQQASPLRRSVFSEDISGGEEDGGQQGGRGSGRRNR